MPRPPSPAVDPAFSAIAKAIYGDDIDPREVLAKSGGAAAPSGNPQKDKKVALTGMAATSVATAGGLHAVSATLKENAHRKAAATGIPYIEKPKSARRLKMGAAGQAAARKVGLTPVRAAKTAAVGYLGLHGVELAADSLAMHAQNKARRQANAQIAKGLRLRPLNVVVDRTPSLKAKRPKLSAPVGSPRTQAGIFQPVRKARMLAPAGHLPPVDGDEVTWTGTITKVDTEQRLVFGWASVSKINGEEVVDLQGDVVPIEEIEKSAYMYVRDSRVGGDMHRRVSKLDDGTKAHHTADLVESFVVTPEKLEKMGLAPDALPHGWWVGYKVNDDEQWSLVKSGGRAGFSIHGSGKRTPVSKADAADHRKAALAGGGVAAVGAVGSKYLGRTANRLDYKAKHAADVADLASGFKSSRHLSGELRGESRQLAGKARLARRARTGGRLVAIGGAGLAGVEAVRARKVSKAVPKSPTLRAVQRTHRTLKRLAGTEQPYNDTWGTAYLEAQSRHEHNIRQAWKAGHSPDEISGLGRSLSRGGGPSNKHDINGAILRPEQAARPMRGKYGREVSKRSDDDGPKLRERVHQAVHPPAVRVKDVKSTAVQSMGYQPQTRRLAVVMRSRPDQPYEYRMKPGAAKDALEAPSKGHHYATEVRGRAKRAKRYTAADRARLFINPDVSKSLRPIGKVPTS